MASSPVSPSDTTPADVGGSALFAAAGCLTADVHIRLRTAVTICSPRLWSWSLLHHEMRDSLNGQLKNEPGYTRL